MQRFVRGIQNPRLALAHLHRQYTDWRHGYRKAGYSRHGYIGFHPLDLPETRDPTQYSQMLHTDWRTVAPALEDISASRLLEIGCSYGRWVPWLSPYTDEYYAVEPVAESIEIAERLYPEVDFANTVVQDLPYPDDHFDLVFAWSVLIHVPQERFADAVSEIKRVTADDGLILLGEDIGAEDDEIVFRRTRDEWEAVFAPKTLDAVYSRNDHLMSTQMPGRRHLLKFS